MYYHIYLSLHLFPPLTYSKNILMAGQTKDEDGEALNGFIIRFRRVEGPPTPQVLLDMLTRVEVLVPYAI